MRPAAVLVGLVWSPRAIAWAASQWWCLWVFWIGIPAYAALAALLFASGVSVAEPFFSVAAAMGDWALLVVIGTLFLSVPLAIPCVLAYVVVARRSGGDPRPTAALRAVALSALPVLAPMTAWSVAAALHGLSGPGVDFVGPAGRPAWLDAGVLAVMASPWWLALIFFLYVLVAGSAVAGLREFEPEGPVCGGCGYSLVGLPGDRCPECGREEPLSAADSSRWAS